MDVPVILRKLMRDLQNWSNSPGNMLYNSEIMLHYSRIPPMAKAIKLNLAYRSVLS